MEELVASVPFSKPDPIQNLRITAAATPSLSLDLGEKDDARHLEFTLTSLPSSCVESVRGEVRGEKSGPAARFN